MTRIFEKQNDGLTNRQREEWIETLRRKRDGSYRPKLDEVLLGLALAIGGAAFIYFTLHTL